MGCLVSSGDKPHIHMNPKVSVVIPTYNRAEKVVKAIESALAQSVTDNEVIVIDDGSSDNTGRVLGEKFCDRIRYHAQPNQGASIARNRGIELARGEWIAFLDSDDMWEKDKLEWQLRALEKVKPQCGGCYTDTRFFNHSETRTMFQLAEENYQHTQEFAANADVLRLLVRPGGTGMVVCLSSFMIRSDVARAAGGFDPKLLYSQDSEFMFRLALRTGFCYVNRPLVLFDRSPAETRHVGVSAEWNKMEFFLKDSQLRLEGLMRLKGTAPKPVMKVIRQQLREIHSGWANLHLKGGHYEEAREAAFKALRTDMTFNIAAKWLLTWISPGLALRTVRQRENKRASAFTV
jgi:glycosyltransferase involved in cell wall biosynthesis